MSQEKKAKIAPVVKKILAKHGIKGSLSVRNHSTLVLSVKQGNVDFITNFNERIAERGAGHVADTYIDVNPYHFQDQFTGKARVALCELHTAMMDGNHDNSDLQSDYFDVGWYVDINIGSWNKPYACTTKAPAVKKLTRTLSPAQRIRVIMNGISFRCKISELDNCMDHIAQRKAVDMALDILRNAPEAQGVGQRFNSFDVQVDLL
jgi:hypothetical protein